MKLSVPEIVNFLLIHYEIQTMIEEVKITRIYSDDVGASHFQDIVQPLLYGVGNKQKITKSLGSGLCRLFEFDADFHCDWHLSSPSCYYIYIQGGQEIEVSDGEKRVFKTGDIILAEDTSGRGHRSRSVFEVNGRALIIPV